MLWFRLAAVQLMKTHEPGMIFAHNHRWRHRAQYSLLTIHAKHVPTHRQNLPGHPLVYHGVGEDKVGQAGSTAKLDCAPVTENEYS